MCHIFSISLGLSGHCLLSIKMNSSLDNLADVVQWLALAISKIGHGESRNGERGTGNGERGTGNL